MTEYIGDFDTIDNARLLFDKFNGLSWGEVVEHKTMDIVEQFN